MEAIILENAIMHKTSYYLRIFTLFFPLLWSILLYGIAFYAFKWLGVILGGEAWRIAKRQLCKIMGNSAHDELTTAIMVKIGICHHFHLIHSIDCFTTSLLSC